MTATLVQAKQPVIPQPTFGSVPAFMEIWIVEDDAQTNARQRVAGVAEGTSRVRVQLHRVVGGRPRLMRSASYEVGALARAGAQRAELAKELLKRARARSGLLVAPASYGSNRSPIPAALERGLHVAVEIRRDSSWTRIRGRELAVVRPENLLSSARWRTVRVVSAETLEVTQFQVAELGRVTRERTFRAFAFAPGSVVDVRGDLRVAVTSLLSAPIEDLVQCVAWVRWIRTLNRRRARARSVPADREQEAPPSSKAPAPLVVVHSRPNIRLARHMDAQMVATHDNRADASIPFVRTVMDLFAGAGGIGLGFLQAGADAGPYRLLASAEVQPIYVQTLRSNHDAFRQQNRRSHGRVPGYVEPLDLRTRGAQTHLEEVARQAGGLDVLVGGPPCQGFSMANRNSWAANNPNNQLVDVFLRLVRRLQPRFALIENVQGILWTERNGSAARTSVADHVARALRRAGYWPFAKLLDAVWYGVPQHRARFFLLAVHKDIGYSPDDFDSWGPFPRPTHGPATGNPNVTVADAIGDLPPVGNGAVFENLPYREPTGATLAENPYLARMRIGAEPGFVTDHVTSRHADYVLERYRRIPPGKNWHAIVDMLSNYATVDRTHSNIYRRLRADEPAITIGHYRKSMLVHPSQDRGLSLREAARIQSFPDWFRFAGTHDGAPGGLMHKQQQLANAVCPLVAQAVAEFLLLL